MTYAVYDDTNSVREVNGGPRLPIPAGWTETELPDDHPDIVAFRAARAAPLPPPPDPLERLIDAFAAEAVILPAKADALKARLRA